MSTLINTSVKASDKGFRKSIRTQFDTGFVTPEGLKYGDKFEYKSETLEAVKVTDKVVQAKLSPKKKAAEETTKAKAKASKTKSK